MTEHPENNVHAEDLLMDKTIDTIARSSERLRKSLDLCPECFYGSLILSLYATACSNGAFDEEGKQEMEARFAEINSHGRKLH